MNDLPSMHSPSSKPAQWTVLRSLCDLRCESRAVCQALTPCAERDARRNSQMPRLPIKRRHPERDEA